MARIEEGPLGPFLYSGVPLGRIIDELPAQDAVISLM